MFSLFQVQEIFSKPVKSKQRIDLFTKLRKKGNFLKGDDACKPMKRTNIHETTRLPCVHCLGYYSSKQLYRHAKICRDNTSKQKSSQALSQNKIVGHLKIDPQLKERVFPHMRADKISLTAKKDQLICAFGARYIKLHRERHFVNVASRKMRELAKVLIELMKLEPSIRSMFDALQPKYFDLFIEATKIIGRYQSDTDVFEAPTFAMNISTTLKQCCDIAINFALKKQYNYANMESAEVEANLKTMIHLFNANWRFEISSQASNNLNLNKWNKVTIIPLANDLKLLKNYLTRKASEAYSALSRNSADKYAFSTLLETVYCRLILLNRKRPGELQRMYLHTYQNSDFNKTSYEEFDDVISAPEKVLLKTFKRVVIRGKRGHGVPVLVSSEVQEHIKLLIEARKSFINNDNPFLFALPNKNNNSSICGYKVLQKYTNACGAKNPQALTSTRLRKHLATLTQIFSMNEGEIEQLASFMGHTLNVHKKSYRLPDDVYQTAKISKLLLLMENGNAGNFKGKTLDEININMEEDLLEITKNDQLDSEPCESDNDDMPVLNSTADISRRGNEETDDLTRKCFTAVRKKKRILIPWTEEEKTVVKNYFTQHISRNKPPKRAECEHLIEQYPDLLKNKSWLKIKVFIQNIYTKKCKT